MSPAPRRRRRRRARRASPRSAPQSRLQVPPRVEAGVLHRHVRAEERDEHRQRRVQTLAPRLDVVAQLVHEDQEHEADREPPAPEERVAADRDEDAEELQAGEAELDDQAEGDRDGCPDRLPDLPPVGPLTGRPVLGVRLRERARLVGILCAHASGRLSLPPGRAGLRERLTLLAARSEAGRRTAVPGRTVRAPPGDGSHRERRPRDVSKLTAARSGGRPPRAGAARRSGRRGSTPRCRRRSCRYCGRSRRGRCARPSRRASRARAARRPS